MRVITPEESQRLIYQAQLDSSKSQVERNKLGQFATPGLLAYDIVKYGLELVSKRQAVKFLDPAFGTGAFYSALKDLVSKDQLKSALGFEIDQRVAEAASTIWKDDRLEIRNVDFTLSYPDNERVLPNLLICNPPYVRHHYIDSDNKERMQTESQRILGQKISGLSGLYCYFLFLSHNWLANNGIAGWLIPSEFMNVNYGVSVKQYLLNKVVLLRIHRFDPTDLQFKDALVSSTVVWFKKGESNPNDKVMFTYGGTHNNPKHSEQTNLSDLDSGSKWTRYAFKKKSRSNSISRLGNYFTIKRGIATGNNSFFLLSPKKVNELSIPPEVLVPVLPSPKNLDNNIINADQNGIPAIDNFKYLLNCNLLETEVKTRFPELWKYLKSGVPEVSTRYICRNRLPWYSQERRIPSSFLCTYIGRNNNGTTFRFILNKSRAIVTNSYLMLYPKPVLLKAIIANPEFRFQIWSYLNSIENDVLLNEARVYGGGMYKLEPRELANVHIEDFESNLQNSSLHLETQVELFDY